MPIIKFISAYLNFSKRDRIGIIAVFALILIVYFLPRFFSRVEPEFPITTGSILGNAIDTLKSRENAAESNLEERPASYAFETSSGFSKGELFGFDPNTLPSEGWKRLGLKNKTITTINRFRNKGGRFYKPEDLQKIWGLPKGFYDRVKDHIMIPAIRRDISTQHFPESKTFRSEKKIEKVSINDADTSAFIALPGIGSKLALRIVNFREKLGGFFSVDQVAETFGLKDSTFQKIRPYLEMNGGVKRFHLNTTTREELQGHPYFKWNLSNAIIEYRNQHGNYKSLDELKNISLIDEAKFNKIVHYLEL